MKEINRLKILQDVIDRNLRHGQAAEMLGITPRHCSRLLKRYRQLGPQGNHPSPHDKKRTLDPPQTTRTENPSAPLPAALYW